jgi:hypothetical protein
MNKMILYRTDEVGHAFDRFKAVTGASRTEFLTWLGYKPWAMDAYPENEFVNVNVFENTSAHQKFEMLLNQHWYALLKAHIVKEPLE